MRVQVSGCNLHCQPRQLPEIRVEWGDRSTPEVLGIIHI
jgi:hypothetical protein